MSARLAGLAALIAAAAWIMWALLDAMLDGALDGPRTGPTAVWGWIGTALHVTWTMFVVPAAVVLACGLRALAPRLIPLATAAGVISLVLWTAAALGRWWPAGLEPIFLALSAVWWLGLGWTLRPVRPRLGLFTLVLGVAAGLDAAVTAAEGRLPAWAFPILGGPKLPLQVIWTISAGVLLWRGHPVVPKQPPRPRATTSLR